MVTESVLVVDADPDVRDMTAKRAEGLGFRVTAVESAEAFKAACLVVEPDVVVLDLLLPGEDGIQLAIWLAARNSAARVVLASGCDPLYTRTALNVVQASGADAVALRKPFSPRELKRALESGSAGQTAVRHGAAAEPVVALAHA